MPLDSPVQSDQIPPHPTPPGYPSRSVYPICGCELRKNPCRRGLSFSACHCLYAGFASAKEKFAHCKEYN